MKRSDRSRGRFPVQFQTYFILFNIEQYYIYTINKKSVNSNKFRTIWAMETHLHCELWFVQCYFISFLVLLSSEFQLNLKLCNCHFEQWSSNKIQILLKYKHFNLSISAFSMKLKNWQRTHEENCANRSSLYVCFTLLRYTSTSIETYDWRSFLRGNVKVQS